MRTLPIVVMAVTLSATGAQAQGKAAGAEQPITKKNWMKHPKIVEVREIFQANEAAAKNGTLKVENKPVCEPPAMETERTAMRDAQGRIRKYVTEGGSEDSAYRMENHYDDQGRLRFVYATSGAVTESSVEHRLYFAIDGKLFWHDRREKGEGYTWIPKWPEEYVVRDAEKAWKEKTRCDGEHER